MMTKKNYIALAKALEGAFPVDSGIRLEAAAYGWRNCVTAIARVLEEDNDRFDRERFIAACEGRDR